MTPTQRRAARVSLTPFARPTPAAPTEPARARAERRQGRAERRVTPVQAPYTPRLAHPTRAQRQATQRIVQRGVQSQRTGVGDRTFGQGFTNEEIARQVRVSPQLRGRIGAGAHAAQRSGVTAAARYGMRQGAPERAPTSTAAAAEGARGRLHKDMVRESRLFRRDPQKYMEDLRTQVGAGIISGQVARDRVKALQRGGPVQVAGLSTGLKASPATRAVGAALKAQILSGQGVDAANFATHAVPHLVKNFGKDAANFPVDAVKGSYEVVRAINDLMGPPGPERTARAKKLWNGLDDGFLGQLVLHGDGKKALKALEEHPLYSALEVTGTYGAAGRIAGAASRAGLLGRGARRFAQTARTPLTVIPGTNLKWEQSYSKNLFTQAGQKFAERRAARRGLDPFQAKPGPIRDKLSAVTQGGIRPGQRGMARQIADEFASQQEGVRRGNRDQLRRLVRDVANVHFRGDKEISKHRDLLIAGMENRITPGNLRGDLLRERDRYERVYRDEFERLTPDQRTANRRAVRTYDRALQDRRFLDDPAKFFGAVEELKARSHEITAGLTAAGVLEHGQAVAAAERPRAVALGAERSTDPITPVAGPRTAQAEQAAKAAAKAKDKHERVLRQHGALMESERRGQEALRQSDPKAIEEALGQLDERHTAATEQLQHAQTAMANARTPAARAHFEELAHEKAAELQRTEALAEGLQAELKNLPDRQVMAKVAASEARLKGSHEKVKEARAARREAEQNLARARRAARKETKPRPASGMARGGQRLSTDELVAEREAAGLSEPGFVTHRPDTRGSAAFFQNWFPSRKSADPHLRTGESTRVGGHEQSYAALEESLAHGQGILDAVQGWDRFLHEFGQRGPQGEAFTWTHAEHLAAEHNRLRGGHTGGEDLVPVRMAPGRYGDDRLRMILDMQDSALQPDTLKGFMEERVREALQRPADGRSREAKNVVLVPASMVKRVTDHQLQGATTVARAMSKFTGQFRKTVLPFSPKWFTGNVLEGVLRSGIAGVLPVYDGIQMHNVVKQLEKKDPVAADALRTRLFGGLIFGTTDRTSVYREGAMRGTAFEMPKGGMRAQHADGGATLRAKIAQPAVLAIQGIVVLQKLLFGANKGFEKYGLQYGAAGKIARREMQEMTGSWQKALRFQKGAVDDLVNGLLGTPKQVRFARELDEMLGKYQRFSPQVRRMTQNAMPFLPWYLAAARFVAHTLPAKHPVKTALLASVERTMQSQWAAEYKDTPEGDLMSAIRTKRGGYVPLAHYTPFGAWSELKPKGLEVLLEPVLPQLSAVIKIQAAGQNFQGRQLQLSEDTWVPHREGRGRATPTGWGRTFMAMNSAVESLVPFVQIGRRLQEQGQSPLDDSLFFRPRSKPGTSYGTSPARRVFDPFRPTYLQAPTGGATAIKGAPAAPADPILQKELELARRDAAKGPSAAEKSILQKEIELARRGGG